VKFLLLPFPFLHCVENEVYKLFAEIQTTHWWFVARRAILEEMLKRHVAASPALRLADIGCGAGTMLTTLAQFGEAWGN
jgi:2-polyprenyl-3-methyl-5-hydroxy-6-metoxy-1,4-benzoquinol methylase